MSRKTIFCLLFLNMLLVSCDFSKPNKDFSFLEPLGNISFNDGIVEAVNKLKANDSLSVDIVGDMDSSAVNDAGFVSDTLTKLVCENSKSDSQQIKEINNNKWLLTRYPFVEASGFEIDQIPFGVRIFFVKNLESNNQTSDQDVQCDNKSFSLPNMIATIAYISKNELNETEIRRLTSYLDNNYKGFKLDKKSGVKFKDLSRGNKVVLRDKSNNAIVIGFYKTIKGETLMTIHFINSKHKSFDNYVKS